MKKIKLVTKVIAIIILCLIGFVGIYLPWKKPIEMNNEIKDFQLGKDFTGYREIILDLSEAKKVLDSDKNVVGDTDMYDDSSIKSYNYTKSDESVNNSESINVQNYEKSKNIIEKRLNKLGVQEYNLSMDKETGRIYIQIPENSITDRVVSNITEIGSVELKDSKDSSKVFVTSENLKKARVMYGNSTSGTAVYLDMQFDNETKKVLKDLSENDYKKIEETTEDKDTEEDKENEDKKAEEESEEKTEQKEVAVYISGSKVTTTSFEEPVTDGKISLRMGQVSTDTETIQSSVNSASTVATILNNGVMPLKYKVTENQFIESEIKIQTIKTILIVITAVFIILLVYMIIKYKKRGIITALCYLAFVSLFTILLRVFNVTITMEGIVGGIIILALNYIISMRLIEIQDNKKYYKVYLDIIMKLLPIFVLSIIFVFIPIMALSSIGMVLFWGIFLSLVYNVAITKHILD